jgi:hypothetical protein
MTEFPVPDCLVLKIEERDCETLELDTTLYIFYDKKYHNYVIRGRRRVTPKYNSCEYSFVCEDLYDLVYFITFVIEKKNLWTYVVYNYDNFPIDSNEICFDFMSSNDHPDYELGAYENEKYNSRRLMLNVRMLRNVFNFYK